MVKWQLLTLSPSNTCAWWSAARTNYGHTHFHVESVNVSEGDLNVYFLYSLWSYKNSAMMERRKNVRGTGYGEKLSLLQDGYERGA